MENLYAYLTGPSARNAWHHYLYNFALTRGLIGGVIDTAACVEASPASATGAGSGLWLDSADELDGTHPNVQEHTVTLLNCIKPAGTSPSAVWTIQ